VGVAGAEKIKGSWSASIDASNYGNTELRNCGNSFITDDTDGGTDDTENYIKPY
jgi:hypothetical protein